MPGPEHRSGAGHRGRPHPSRSAPGPQKVLAASGGGRSGRTVLVSSSGTVAPGWGSVTEAPERPAPGDAPGRRGRRQRRRRSRGERILRWSLVVVAVVLVIAAIGYGYVRYRWGQVKTLACNTCAAVADGEPFNVLLVGSDTRVGQGTSFGSVQQAGGQRSDTIKILHVDPNSGTARLLSIPRDTFVQMSDVPASTGLAQDQKINASFDTGPQPLIATIENTFGIPIQHFVEVDFTGLENAVNTLGGINLNFPYPVRDNDNGINNSGLNITKTGCQLLNGQQTLGLARSRYYQYYANGYWHYDGSSDIGRIERQNIVIQAIAAKAKGSFNPLTVNAFLGGVVHDITVDQNLSFGDMLSLATKYHAFSPSSLQSFTLPVVPAVSSQAGDVEIVNQPQAEQVLTQFLGHAPGPVSTPPLDRYGNPIFPPSTTTTTAPPSSQGSTPTPAPAPSPSASAPSFDPTVC